EINTWIWLRELSLKHKKKITLATIPGKDLDELAKLGFDAVWLMGVWKRSQAGLIIAKQHEGIMKDLREALPDLNDEDIAGSPYCIKDYQTDPVIGGDKGLAKVRKELAARGMKLILDFVPNHVAPDHPWTKTHPDYFIKGTEEELSVNPDDFFKTGKIIYAKARDPFYPPWPDVLQLNLFNEGLRDELLKTLKSIAGQCDGIRCDMAMLVMNDIFKKTWAEKAGTVPVQDFWDLVIPAVKKQFPDFIFIAESYWDMEQALISQGFDFCYDKRYYDDLKEGAGRSIQHISDVTPFQHKLLRFLENHDEPRAAALYDFERQRALALASLTLPGARLLHDGQISGRKIKVPVFLSRRADEKPNADIRKFYLQLLKLLRFEAIRKGKWSACVVSGWPDNQSCQNLLAWEWVSEHESLMIVVNLSDQPSQALIKSSIEYRPGRTYQLYDVTSGELYRRDGEEMTDPGLYVVLKGWGVHSLSIEH
ncbi:MAG: alpha-amylase, partial [Bacteroidales bacterium]|nr:alpha-amylase [Bacteroidales bacterium]